MEPDLAIVLGVALLAVALYPSTEEKLHRAAATWRFWRNGYSLRVAWRLAEGR